MKKTIKIIELAGLASLSERRIYQLCEDGKLAKPENGALPLNDSLRRLFAHFQADDERIKTERLKMISAERRREERRDRLEAHEEDRDWMKTTKVVAMLEIGIRTIENIPGKLESEFALKPEITKRLQQLLDEARADWVKHNIKAGEGANQ